MLRTGISPQQKFSEMLENQETLDFYMEEPQCKSPEGVC